MTDSRDEKTVQVIAEKYLAMIPITNEWHQLSEQAVMYEALREAIKLTRDQQWIAVTPETMPEIKQGFRVSEDVLTWDGVARHIGHISQDTEEYWEQVNSTTQKKRVETSISWRFDDGNWYNVTHWQPLPSPPSREQQ